MSNSVHNTNNLYSTKRENGTTDYYYWGLNCQIMGMTDLECRKVINAHDPEMSLDNRDTFWEGFVNGHVWQPHEFTKFSVYITQGGGIAKDDKLQKRYVFVVPPAAGTNLGCHDYVPEEWSVHPANNKVDAEHQCENDIPSLLTGWGLEN